MLSDDNSKPEKMKDIKKKELEELCYNGKWTEFLNGLPTNHGGTFRFQTPGQIMSLRVVASQQSTKPGGTRKYSVKGINYDDLTAFVEATPRDNGNN